jgi:N-glycosidase YbiA
MTVERFRQKYFPFSNMYPLENWIMADCGILVPTSEHAYMANRFISLEAQELVAKARGAEGDTSAVCDGIAAKEAAYRFIDAGYEQTFKNSEERVALMSRVVRQKLAKNATILTLLLETEEQEIFEGNEWGDRFWGVSPVGSRCGENNLGKVYMSLRSEYSTAT